MLRSLMTAVTGVRAHQTMLDVTGNNIANVNTTGYKKDMTVFQDLLYQTTSSASAAGDGRGGTNPAQVGLGVSVAAIETVFTQGAANYTGNKADMMINGNGFFVYNSGSDVNYYSRAGANSLDANNNIVQSGTGYYLQGYAMTESATEPGTYTMDTSLSNMTIALGTKIPAKATSTIKYQCNLNSESTAWLPYGFADIPYNQNANTTDSPAVYGYSGNRYGTAEIEMGSNTYYMSFETNLDTSTPLATPSSAAAAGTVTMNDTTAGAGITTVEGITNYLSISIGTNNDMKTATSINFDMVTTSGGNPELVLSVPSSDANYQGYIQDSNNQISGLVYQYPGTSGNSTTDYFVVSYDSTSGQMLINELSAGTAIPLVTGADANGNVTVAAKAGSNVLFQYNVSSKTNYAAVSATALTVDRSGATPTTNKATINIIGEFDERNLSSTDNTATLYLWYQVPAGEYSLDGGTTNTLTVSADSMIRASAKVYFNPDGTFRTVDPIVVDSSSSNITLTGAGTATGAVDELATLLGAGNFSIVPDDSGTSLLFQQTINNATTTAGTITQGSGVHYTKQEIYDCNGNGYTLEVKFSKITENRWRWDAYILDDEGNSVTELTCDDGSKISVSSTEFIPTPNTGEINFCGCGPIVNPETAEITIPFSLAGMPNSTISLNFGADGQMSGVTQYASETTTKAVYQDGYKMGILEDYSIGSDGTITGIYTNDQNIPLYRVALATFANEQGLEKVGETMFRATVNSGNADIAAAGTGQKGTITAQTVEMSNVDLTEEFTHLILAQRGFQANSRVITTSDSILEEVVNLKR